MVLNIFRPLWSSYTLQLDKSKNCHVTQRHDIYWHLSEKKESGKKCHRKLKEKIIWGRRNLATSWVSKHLELLTIHICLAAEDIHAEFLKVLVEQTLKCFTDHKFILKSLYIWGGRGWEVGREEKSIQGRRRSFKYLIIGAWSLNTEANKLVIWGSQWTLKHPKIVLRRLTLLSHLQTPWFCNVGSS